jgi:hypothetical protein
LAWAGACAANVSGMLAAASANARKLFFISFNLPEGLIARSQLLSCSGSLRTSIACQGYEPPPIQSGSG